MASEKDGRASQSTCKRHGTDATSRERLFNAGLEGVHLQITACFAKTRKKLQERKRQKSEVGLFDDEVTTYSAT